MRTILTTCWNESSPQRDGQVRAGFLVFNCVLLTLTLALGLPANLLVCGAVFRNKRLQTSNNALLVSLAASDLLKCCVDSPLFLFSFLSAGAGRGATGGLCALQQFFYALCSVVQLLTLLSISVERFHAIAFPFHTQRRRSRVCMWIPSIWVCGVVLACVSLTLSRHTLDFMLCRRRACGPAPEDAPPHSDPFGVYVLVPVWALCLTGIVIYYARIFNIVRQHRRKVLDHGVHLKPTSKHVWRWFSDAASNPGPPAPPAPPQRRLITVAEVRPCRVGDPLRGPPPEFAGAVCLLTPLARERGKKRIEGRLAQRLGSVILVFTLFWAPMVASLLRNILSRPDATLLVVELETSAMVLTCVPAAVDPLLYTMVTRQFRSEFSKMLSSLSVCLRTQTTQQPFSLH